MIIVIFILAIPVMIAAFRLYYSIRASQMDRVPRQVFTKAERDRFDASVARYNEAKYWQPTAEYLASDEHGAIEAAAERQNDSRDVDGTPVSGWHF